MLAALLAVGALAALGQAADLCASLGSAASVCVIDANSSAADVLALFSCAKDSSKVYDMTRYACAFGPAGSLELRDVRLSSFSSAADPATELVDVSFALAGNLTLVNASVEASRVEVAADWLFADELSQLSAAGLGLAEAGPGTHELYAAAHGGTGGALAADDQCDVSSASFAPFVGSLLVDSDDDGDRYGSGTTGCCRGGGSVALTLEGGLLLDGAVTASGAAAASGDGGDGEGGGAGGSVWISAPDAGLAGGGSLAAEGGAGPAGGGGGRVYVSAASAPWSVSVAGGATSTSSAVCNAGAPGTVAQGSVVTVSAGSGAGDRTLASTPLSTSATTVDVEVASDAVVTLDELSAKSVTLTGALAYPSPDGDGGIVLAGTSSVTVTNLATVASTRTARATAPAVTLTDCTLQGSDVLVEGATVSLTRAELNVTESINATATDRLTVDVVVVVEPTDSTYVSALFQGGASAQVGTLDVSGDGRVLVASGGDVQLTGTSFLPTASLMAWAGGDVNVSAQIAPPTTECDDSTSEVVAWCLAGPDAWARGPPLLEGAAPSLSVLAPTGAVWVQEDSVLSAAAVVLCGDVVAVDGTVSTTALGCEAGDGLGAGSTSEDDLASGGGAHAGAGGDCLINGWDSPDTGGEAYESAEHRTPGSGAGELPSAGDDQGGGGGGVVALVAGTQVRVDGLVEASGAAGAGTSGGGGGGAVFVATVAVRGGGNFTANGGDGGVSSNIEGGGGGGGVVFVDFADGGLNASDTASFTGWVNVAGGAGGLGGDAGNASASECAAGRGGALCWLCEPGSYSDDLSGAACEACPLGTSAPDAGAEQCSNCTAGTYANETGLAECAHCPAGQWSPSGWTSCALCAANSFATGGSANCTLCPAGSFSAPGAAECTDCPVGKYSTKDGVSCSRCKNAPSNAYYTTLGVTTNMCPYACDAGYSGVQCDSKFEALIRPLGGVGGFIGVVLGALLGAVGAARLVRRFRASSGVRGGGSGGARKSWRRSTESQKDGYAPLAQDARKASMTQMRMTHSDLSHHVYRLHLSGYNLPGSPLQLRLSPPSEAHALVHAAHFAAFARELNATLAFPAYGWEHVAVLAARVLCYPAAAPLLALFRRKRQRRAAAFIGAHSLNFLAGSVARSKRDGVRLGHSPDLTTAYLDFLWLEQAGPPPAPLLLGRANLPLVFALAGDGSFDTPFHVDTNDVLVRAVPARLELLIDDKWVDFVAGVNRELRTVPLASFAAACGPLLDVLREANASGSLQNLQVSVCLMCAMGHLHQPFGVARMAPEAVPPCFADDGKPCLVLTNDRVGFESELYRPSTMVVELPEAPAPPSPSPTTSSTGTASSAVSSIRQQALYDDDPDDMEPLNGSGSSWRRRSRSQGAGRFGTGGTVDKQQEEDEDAPSTLRQQFPRTAGLLELRADGSVARWSAWRLLGMRLRAGCCVAQRALPIFAWVLQLAIAVLIIVDVACFFLLELDLVCVQVRDPNSPDGGCSRSGFFVLLLVPPLATVVAPAMGLRFIVTLQRGTGRAFQAWNAMSMVSMGIALIEFDRYRKHLRGHDLALPLSSLACKALLAALAPRLVASIENQRTRPGWRGLYTTQEGADDGGMADVRRRRLSETSW